MEYFRGASYGVLQFILKYEKMLFSLLYRRRNRPETGSFDGQGHMVDNF